MNRPALGSSAAVTATVVAFVTNGLGVGTLGGLMPTLAVRWDTDARGLGLLLMVGGITAIAGINVGGRWADRSGARTPIALGAVLMALGLAALAGAGTLPVALACMVLYGAGNGLVDTCMNAMAVQVEEHRPRPIMSRMHACWSLGSFLGAGLVLLVGALVTGAAGIAATALIVAALVLAATAPVVLRLAPDTELVDHLDETGVRSRIPSATWILAVMAVGFGLSEGTAFDWSSVHVGAVADLDSSRAAWGLAVFSICMVGVRFAGDHLVERLGRRLVVRFGAGTAAVGYVLAVTQTPLAVLLFAWGLVGAGMALVAPQIYGLAGQLGGGRGLSVVVTFGYACTLVGPGVMGILVHEVGVAHAMILPLVGACVVSALSWVMPSGGRAPAAH